jgi:hypothetical protein
MKCPKCRKEVQEKNIDHRTEELWCQHCRKWHFYGTLAGERVQGGTMKPDNVTEILKSEYDGKTDYHL